MEDAGDKEEEITIEDEQEAANLKHVPEPHPKKLNLIGAIIFPSAAGASSV